MSCRELSARYRKATELALEGTNFAESKDLSTLQTLTLFMVNTKYSKFISSLEPSNTSLFCSL
jgi:vacuolar-type H+-ATPase subunit C/Vma6